MWNITIIELKYLILDHYLQMWRLKIYIKQDIQETQELHVYCMICDMLES
jgi:hypothetical protein